MSTEAGQDQTAGFTYLRTATTSLITPGLKTTPIESNIAASTITSGVLIVTIEII